jgi:DNA-binding NtrC family response regulator
MIVSTGTELTIEGIPNAAPLTAGRRPDLAANSAASTQRTLAEVERDHILAVCTHCGWRINGRGNAAERLGLNPNTLRSKMKRLGIERPPVGAEPRSPEPA